MKADRVHLVFKTHLDIGFTDHAAAVRRQYHDRFIPQALDTAEHFLREDADNPRFIWTTGAWLIHDHLEQADAAGRARLERAIGAGVIRWHALPFTSHSELTSPSVFRAGLSYAQGLDARFGMVTRAAKMTDVPGHTLGIVPLLAAAGVRFLHLGVNAASPVPDLPDVFRWRAPCGAEIVVMYQPDYGALHLPDGMAEALAFAHTQDNIGPQSVPQVAEVWRDTAKAVPGATIRAATLEEYGALLWDRRDTFPLWQGEIGDSWIHGAGSDPVKLARFRALQRLHDRFEEEGLTPERRSFGRALAMVAEHTWGADIKSYLRDETAWDGPALAQARARDFRFRFCEESWEEQRAFLDRGIAALEAGDRARARAVLAPLSTPARIAGQGELPGWRVGHDPATGDILALRGPDGFALSGAPLCAFRHRDFDAADIDRHLDSYLTARPDWAWYDHAKPGLARSGAGRSALAVPEFTGCTCDGAVMEIAARLSPGAVDHVAPSEVAWRLTPLRTGIEIALILRGKPANRRPEAGFWTVAPAGAGAWRLLKTGIWIDPRTSAPAGGGALHAVFAARAHTGARNLRITPLDTALIAPQDTDFMGFPHDPPPWRDGVQLVVYNNKWGTNFPMWWDGDLVSRLHLTLTGGGGPDN